MTGRNIKAKQVKQKLMILKRIYYKQQAEEGENSTSWPFYQDMDEILSRVPESPAESDVYDESSDEEDVEEKGKGRRGCLCKTGWFAVGTQTISPKPRSNKQVTNECSILLVRLMLLICYQPKENHPILYHYGMKI